MLITPKEYLTCHCYNTGTNLKYLLSCLGCGKTPITFFHCSNMWEKLKLSFTQNTIQEKKSEPTFSFASI